MHIHIAFENLTILTLLSELSRLCRLHVRSKYPLSGLTLAHTSTYTRNASYEYLIGVRIDIIV